MDPELMEIFCDEYARHRNAIAAKANAGITQAKAELAKVDKEIDRLVQAILDGVPGSRVKEKMGQLEARKTELEAKLVSSTEDKISVHPKMADTYRKHISQLRTALTDEGHRAEAVSLIRGLIDRIVLTPEEINGKTTLSVDLHGDIVEILSASAQTKKPPQKGGLDEKSIKLVAGAGFGLKRRILMLAR